MKQRFHVRPIAVLLAAAVVAVAAFSTSASGAGGPVNSVPPTVSGTAKTGETLTSSPGTWAPTPTSFTYAWQRCTDTGTACANIAGANAATYVPGSADVGNTVRVMVTAFDGVGSTDAPTPSAVTAVITSAAPQNSAPPTVSGTPTEGQTLIAADGTWTGATPITFAYAWSRCDATGAACLPIAGAVNKTYVLVAADNGKALRVAVTAKNTLGTRSESSAPTAEITPLAPPSVITLPSGGKSIDATDVKSPALLVIDKVAFSPNPLRSRSAFTAKIHVSDTRGFAVRNALVFIQGLPFGRASTPAEVKTGSDGTATLALIPTRKLPLQRGASLVMFVRARVAGDRLIAGVSARRLVNLRVVPS